MVGKENLYVQVVSSADLRLSSALVDFSRAERQPCRGKIKTDNSLCESINQIKVAQINRILTPVISAMFN